MNNPKKLKIEIPELVNYPGCKGGNGVYQNIISLIPPHKKLIIPFLGHCGIARNILPGNILICVDKSGIVINAWKRYLINVLNYYFVDSSCSILKSSDERSVLPGIIHLYQDDAIHFLSNYNEFEDSVIYCDPPYPFSTRRSKANIYKHEMSDKQHLQLSSLLLGIRSSILISSYKNDIYSNVLEDWNTHEFYAATRGGKAKEIVYYNYDLSDGLLHDYRYLGKNFKDRERIKLKIDRWSKGLQKLEPRERMAIIKKITQVSL